MKPDRLGAIASRFCRLRIALIGDIALDRYLHIDPALAETSLETGLVVHNVVAVRPQPGAGGNVLANLAALRPKSLAAVGFSGDDGEGVELRRALESLGVDLTHFLVRADRTTFTYTKPLVMVAPASPKGGPPEELSRLDFRSRTPTPAALEDEIIRRLRQAVAGADVVVAMDQVPEPENGVLTRRVKAALADVARAYPEKVFIGDSRTSPGDFADVRMKTNRAELARRFGAAVSQATLRPAAADVQALALQWAGDLGRDVFATLGEQGIVAASQGRAVHVPGIRVEPPIDVTGAGDAVLASIAMALGAGADAFEAAEIGNLAGAVVVKKIGTTGAASVEELAAMLKRGQ
jgi:rfaE bifunctional protein kinase chain/domain